MPGLYVYHNSGVGPVDYDTVRATLATSTTVWTSAALSYPATWRFGLRAYNANGEEQNVNSVQVILDASGYDATAQPNPAHDLSATPRPGGVIRLRWSYLSTGETGTCTKFNIYGNGGTGPVDFAIPLDSVSKTAGTRTSYTWDSSALTHGTTYRYVVRAATSVIEEQNRREVSATADTQAPALPASLSIVVTR